MPQVGNDRVGTWPGGGKRPRGKSPVGKRRGEDAGGGGPPDTKGKKSVSHLQATTWWLSQASPGDGY